MITQKELKEELHYNPDTGVFTWLKHKGDYKRVGQEAGGLDDGYRRIAINGRIYRAHRLAFLYMEGSFPPHMVDHINDNKSDNRYCNLRKATNSQNQRSRAGCINSVSGYKGVSPIKSTGRWRAVIQTSGKRKHIGVYTCKHEAASAYNEAAVELHGEFARLNEVGSRPC